MRKTLRLTRYLALATAGASAIGLVIGLRSVTAKESPTTDCLIAIQGADETDKSGTIECTDCDPACDDDANNSAPNGQCSFKLRAVLNVPTATCTAKDLKKAKVVPPKAGISITANGSSSVVGAFSDVVLKLKGKKKQVVKVIKGMAIANGKPRAKDIDKLKLVCRKQTAAVCPTTTTTTTTLPGVCGDKIVTSPEECDPSAAPNGCPAGSLCQADCTCLACTPTTGTLLFTTGTNVASNCGGVGLNPPAADHQSGAVTVHDIQANTNADLAIGAGCLYVGGGASTVPGGATPDGSTSMLDVTHTCADAASTLLVGPHTGDKLSCTKGAGPGKSCINDLTTFPLATCTTDADCGGVAGACVDTPNCFFGPPLPIENGPLSTCVVNSIGADASGTIGKTTGNSDLTLPLRSHTFVTGDSTGAPCVLCQDLGSGPKCQGGPRDQLACVPVGTQQTSLDCPPPGPYLPEFPVLLSPLATRTVSLEEPTGVFCPPHDGQKGQGYTPDDSAPGAAGTNQLSGTDLVKVATKIVENGTPAGDISDMASHPATLASVFCIPATGNGLIDGAASLPGPGAVTLPGAVQLQ